MASTTIPPHPSPPADSFVAIASGQAAKLHAIQKTCLEHGIEFDRHESDAIIHLSAKIPTLTSREGSQSHDVTYLKIEKATQSDAKKPKCSTTKAMKNAGDYCFTNGFQEKTKMLIPALIILPEDVSGIDEWGNTVVYFGNTFKGWTYNWVSKNIKVDFHKSMWAKFLNKTLADGQIIDYLLYHGASHELARPSTTPPDMMSYPKCATDFEKPYKRRTLTLGEEVLEGGVIGVPESAE